MLEEAHLAWPTFSVGKAVDTCICSMWRNLIFPSCITVQYILSEITCRVKCQRFDDSIYWVLLWVIQRTCNSQKSCRENVECIAGFSSTKLRSEVLWMKLLKCTASGRGCVRQSTAYQRYEASQIVATHSSYLTNLFCAYGQLSSFRLCHTKWQLFCVVRVYCLLFSGCPCCLCLLWFSAAKFWLYLYPIAVENVHHWI